MSLFEDTNPRDLKELLGQIHSREAALPDFQRDFVWDPSATQELIVSIANNYPAGSLLRIQNSQRLFASREFAGAPALDGRSANYLVLDGQQRLTSLYQAFYGVGEHRYYLNLRRLLGGEDFEDCIFHFRIGTRDSERLNRFETQARELILPLSVLKGGAGGFSQWTIDIARALSHTGVNALEQIENLGRVHEKWIQPIDDYKFPVVTLKGSVDAAAVCTIFETLNRTGVKLSAFELLTARFWPHDINLRQLWDDARERSPIIADMEIDPYYALQILALAIRQAPSCKRNDVLNLKPDDIRQGWDDAVRGLTQALEILREDCGVLVPKWLPYNTIVNPMGAVLAKKPLPAGPRAAEVRGQLVRWFWCSVFGQTYENAPNSQSARDVTELLGWLDGGAPPQAVSALRFDPAVLRDTTPRQRALYRGVICLILRNQARDFHTNKPITGDLIFESHIDDHHIFPDNFLRKKEAPARRRECVLNRTLIDRTTNIRISDRAPSDYMDGIREAHEKSGTFGMLLSSHFLPPQETGVFDRDDFDTFLQWRQDALWQQILNLTGLKDAATGSPDAYEDSADAATVALESKD